MRMLHCVLLASLHPTSPSRMSDNGRIERTYHRHAPYVKSSFSLSSHESPQGLFSQPIKFRVLTRTRMSTEPKTLTRRFAASSVLKVRPEIPARGRCGRGKFPTTWAAELISRFQRHGIFELPKTVYGISVSCSRLYWRTEKPDD